VVRIMTRACALAATAVAVFAFAILPAGAQQRIGPNQQFAGRVNGRRTAAVVYTACAAPVSAGRTGPVAGGQTLSVVRAKRGNGYTGLFTKIYAWFVPQSATTTTAPVQLKFISYNAPQAIPTSPATAPDRSNSARAHTSRLAPTAGSPTTSLCSS
jgi:hypothetical protein